MGTDSAHRRVSVPPGTLSHPGTLSLYFHCKTKLFENDFFMIVAHLSSLRYTCLMSFTIPEAEGGLGQIYSCEPVSRGKSGSL